MGWKKAIVHAGIAAGSALFTGLAIGAGDGLLNAANLTIAGIATGGAFFASLGASYAAGEFSDVEAPPAPPPAA